METVEEAELATVHKFIEQALELKLKGNAANYNFILQQLRAQQEASSRLKIYLALPRCISSLAKEPDAYRHLLDELFQYDFMSANQSEIQAFMALICHLVSSNTVFVLPSLQMLVRNFCQPKTSPPPQSPPQPQQQPQQLQQPVAGSSSHDEIKSRVARRFEYVHQTLAKLLELAPSSCNLLFPVLCEHLPHKRLDTSFQVAYLENLLTLIPYVPSLEQKVLGLILDQLVAIDVEILLDAKDQEEIFTMDDFLDDDNMPLVGEDAMKQVDVNAEKLDHLMLLVFEYLDKRMASCIQPKPSSNQASRESTEAPLSQEALSLFQSLLKVFETSILHTHRSKYPQFVLFYLCERHGTFQDLFISQLLAAALDVQTPPVTRQSCWAYLASFLARAKYIQVEYLQKALYHLLYWMHHQVDLLERIQARQEKELVVAKSSLAITTDTASSSGNSSDDDDDDADNDADDDADDDDANDDPDPKIIKARKSDKFQPWNFVAALQTVCYLVCFRGLEIAQADQGAGYEFLVSLGWERVVHAKIRSVLTSTMTITLQTAKSYNNGKEVFALAFCQQAIANEFLTFAETFHLVSDETVAALDEVVALVGSSSSAVTSAARSSSGGGAKTLQRSVSNSVMASQRIEPMETFFPFDPYLLRRSYKYIGHLYLFWKHVDPNSSSNCDALNRVKALIKQMRHKEEEEEDEEAAFDSDAESNLSLSLSRSASLTNHKIADGMMMYSGTMSSSMEISTSLGHHQELRQLQKSYMGLSASPPSDMEIGSVGAGSFASRAFHNGIKAFALDPDDDEDDGF